MSSYDGTSPIAPPGFPDVQAVEQPAPPVGDEGDRPGNHDGAEPESSLDEDDDDDE